MIKPVVSYPGSKLRFYEHMVDYFPVDMKVFIEPFFGGGSISLSVADDKRFTKLERMIGGDLYTEMWSLWQGIKQDPAAVEEIATRWYKEWCPHQEEWHNTGFVCDESRRWLPGGEMANFENIEYLTEADKQSVRDKIKLYNIAIEEGKKFWQWASTVDTTQMTTEERAARMYLVNKFSFSGMGDAGSLSKDQFGDFYMGKIKVIYEAHELLQRIELYNVSFEDTMKFAYDDPESTFIFLDPPYAKQEDSALYGKNGSTHKGFPHQHFADHTKEMPCRWFVTYDDSVIVRNLFKGKTALSRKCYFTPFTIPGGYTMAQRNDEDALAGEELFITNYDLKKMNHVDNNDI